MTPVAPITPEQQQQVITATHDHIVAASNFYGYRFDFISISFNLKGRIAGMYRVKAGHREIRFNPYLFAKYFEDNLAVTVPHEVAHYIADLLFQKHKIKPHGAEWRSIMRVMQADSKVTCLYDLTGIPQRRECRHLYHCQCRTHALTTRNHNRIRKQQVLYTCKNCHSSLSYTQKTG